MKKLYMVTTTTAAGESFAEMFSTFSSAKVYLATIRRLMPDAKSDLMRLM